MSDKKSTNTEGPTFEVALDQLGRLVQDLEDGKLTLDESLASYEQGVRLLNQCQAMLAKAERKIEILSGLDADGNAVTHPLVEEEMTLEEKADRRSRRRTAGGNSAGESSGSRGRGAAEGAEQADVDMQDRLF